MVVIDHFDAEHLGVVFVEDELAVLAALGGACVLDATAVGLGELHPSLVQIELLDAFQLGLWYDAGALFANGRPRVEGLAPTGSASAVLSVLPDDNLTNLLTLLQFVVVVEGVAEALLEVYGRVVLFVITIGLQVGAPGPQRVPRKRSVRSNLGTELRLKRLPHVVEDAHAVLHHLRRGLPLRLGYRARVRILGLG